MFWKVADRTIDILTSFCLVVMAVTLGIQIYYRYILNRPLLWCLPVSLYFFIWLIWLGGAAGMRDQRQIKMEFADRYLPDSVKRFLMPAVTLLSLVMLGLLLVKSPELIEIQSQAIYDTFPVNRAALFIVIPIVTVLMVVYQIRVLIGQIKHYYFNPDPERRD